MTRRAIDSVAEQQLAAEARVCLSTVQAWACGLPIQPAARERLEAFAKKKHLAGPRAPQTAVCSRCRGDR
jgi:hypothetical protein